MDVNFLKEFVVLAQSKTFLQAADILFVSQPTLSRHIKNLETELGVQLFERTTRSVKLNKYGNMLLPYAQEIVELHSQFSDKLTVEKQEQHLSLRVGTIPAMAFYGITTVLSHFKEKHKNIKIDVIPSYKTSVIDILRKHGCELAFIREQTTEQNDDIVRLPFTSDHIVAVVPESHPFAEFDSIHLSQLKNEDILTLSRETIICEIVVAACMEVGFEPNMVLTDHNIDHIIDCVSLGMGIAILMDKHVDADRLRSRELKVLDIYPVTSTNISLCYLKHIRLSNAAQEFINTFQSEFGNQDPSE